MKVREEEQAIDKKDLIQFLTSLGITRNETIDDSV